MTQAIEELYKSKYEKHASDFKDKSKINPFHSVSHRHQLEMKYRFRKKNDTQLFCYALVYGKNARYLGIVLRCKYV